MKKLSIISLLIVSILSLMSVSFAATHEESVKPTRHKIAIVPYINTTEEHKDYIEKIIDEHYTNYSYNGDLDIIAAVDVKRALKNAGFDASNMELPEKDVLKSVAEETNADYVVAMELSQLNSKEHISVFQLKIETKTKLRYTFYNAIEDNRLTFQTTGNAENKTVLGGVGHKDPITKALIAAMDKAKEKITSFYL